MSKFIPVILAGGSGERFWPLSRRLRPKQFLTLDNSGRSLLQATSDRLAVLAGGPEKVIVVTGNDYRTQVLEQLPEMPIENLLIEPVARDTAPAILFAALSIAQHNAEAVMGIFPADHAVRDIEAFNNIIHHAIYLADTKDSLITIGITPTFPSTGYGYIEQGYKLDNVTPITYSVERFTEKPDIESARSFLETGKYCWNSGIFIWKVNTILEAFEQYQPELYIELYKAFSELQGSLHSRVREAFPKLEKISIDYAILEKASNVIVIPGEFGWDDLGDWNALERLFEGEGENVAVGSHIVLDTGGAILYTTQGDDLIATIGLEDVVVVRTHDVTLVVRKDRTQDIKKLIQKMKSFSNLERFL